MLGEYIDTGSKISTPLIFSLLFFSVVTEVPVAIYAFANVPFIIEIVVFSLQFV